MTMSDQHQQNDDYTGQEGQDQPWREARDQPEPKGVEGFHAGRHVPESKQRETMDDSGAGGTSRIAGDDGGRGRRGSDESGADGSFGGPGDGSHQGMESTPGRRQSTRHASGHGRNTAGAFGEQDPSANASGQSDYRDAGIDKMQTGPSTSADRTHGSDQ
jgi:hypothetical protein